MTPVRWPQECLFIRAYGDSVLKGHYVVRYTYNNYFKIFALEKISENNWQTYFLYRSRSWSRNELVGHDGVVMDDEVLKLQLLNRECSPLPGG